MSGEHGSFQKDVTIGAGSLLEMPKPLEQLSENEMERKRCIGRIMTHTLKYLTYHFADSGFEWLLPVIFSPSTDPLWPDPGASIEKRIEVEIYGKTVRTTLSMIIHKIVACSLAHPKLFTLSPNVRIERRERARSGIHAYEFTQLDFEVRNATSKEIRSFIEDTISGLIVSLKKHKIKDMKDLDRGNSLNVPETPFKAFDRRELEDRYGASWETQLLLKISDPVWVVNIPREFYDFEDLGKGEWDNYDLFLPKHGEVLSGAKREWEYTKIVKKMERDSLRKENYEVYLKLAKDGRIKPTAGAGIGIERLTSWIVGAKHIGETQTFPKVPGIIYDL